MESENRFVRIKKEDAKYFSYLDPYEKLRLLTLPMGLAMGVLKNEEGKVKPVGLLVATVSEETIIIEWMAVDPEHRWRGIGEEMLYRMFRIAEDADLSTLSVAVMPEYGKERMLRGAEKYFAERLFTTEHSIGGDAEITLGELSDGPIVKNPPKEQPGILSLSEMNGQERWECIKRLAALDNATYTFSPKIINAALDTACSVLCKNNASLEGGLLVCFAGDTLYPLYHYAKNGSVSAAMIARAVTVAEKKYGPNRMVSLMMRQEDTGVLALKVLGYEPKGKLLSAEVKNFQAEQEA